LVIGAYATARSNFGLNSGYEARNANFSSSVLVIVQQALVTQISWSKCWFSSDKR
jgi:hypothetical protein